MAETYSLAVNGLRANTPFTSNKTVTAPDSACQGAQNSNPNGFQYTAMTNGQMLCKNADGSKSWYTLDAERSLPGTPIFKAV